MFEAGKHYHLTYGKFRETENFVVKCVEWTHPLLKCADEKGLERIINTTNSSFLEATPAVAPENRPAWNFGSLADQLKET